MGKYLETNRSLWDGWAEINYRAPSYHTKEFKAGESKLHPIEKAEVGDVRGKSLLHLQCHFGLDTLSWARAGAVVTGVDFSSKGIARAQSLSRELNIPAAFVCSDIYDLPNHLQGQFDIVYTSYGVLCWLPDLGRWGQVIARYLKQGGAFHIVEFHPMINPFDPYNREGTMELKYPYFHREEPLRWVEKGSYADPDAEFVHESFEWPHSVADVVNSLIAAGLKIEHFNEFPYSISECFPGRMREDADGMWHLVDYPDSLPLMFSLKAVKE
jgi:SAM-dependent methyltransferase